MSRKSYMHRFVARFRGNGVLSSFLDLSGKDIADKKWVFILGCYNSGTTLLGEILSQHESISGLGDEGVMLTDKLPRPEDFGWRRMWWKCEDEMKVENGETAVRIKRHWSHFFDLSKPCLLEKSIANTPRTDFFEKHFKPAYFIHLVRNGYAVTEGIHRKAEILPTNSLSAHGTRYPLAMCAAQWRRSLQIVDEQKENLGNFLELTYEDLTDDPDATLNRLCAFLDVKPFGRSLKNAPFLVHQKKEVIRNMNEKSISSLTRDEINVINQTAGDLLRRYNYFIPGK